jgi:SAM-dependent methyltransferase
VPPEANNRELLRQTFNTAAAQYQEARPEYPGELYAALIAPAGLRPEADSLCEVGAGPGKATIPLARRGFRITCVELGAALAGEARRNLAGFDRVTVVNADFETWRPASPEAFGLVFAATAWHWIDPEIRYPKARELLKPGGHLAFWDAVHVFPDGGDPFFREIQDVYGVAVRRFDWEIKYTAEAYIRLLDTFSGHIAMADWQRDRLYGEIRRRLAARPDGQLRRHWGAILHVARTV